MEIYLDIIILENIVINYVILYVTSRFSKTEVNSLKLLAGALLGTAYLVCMILLPQLQIITTILAKMLLSAAIVAVTFRFTRLAHFFRVLAVFYAVTFLFAGTSFALMYIQLGGGIVRNGVLLSPVSLLDTNWSTVLLAVSVTFILLKVIRDMIRTGLMKEKLLVDISIAFDQRMVGIHALVDTGNSLHDPLSNMPVIVVEFMALRDILPDEIRLIFETERDKDLDSLTGAITNSAWFSRFRLIPFTSLGRENGMLIGFRPDYIEISTEKERKGIREVVVGIYNRALSKNEKYRALLSPELI